MTDKWLEEKWMDIEEQKNRLKKSAQEVRKGNLTFGLNISKVFLWLIIGLLLIFGILRKSGLFIVIGAVIFVIMILLLTKKKVKFNKRGWVIFTVIGIFGLLTLSSFFGRIGFDTIGDDGSAIPDSSVLFGQGNCFTSSAGMKIGKADATARYPIDVIDYNYIDGITSPDVFTAYSTANPNMNIGTICSTSDTYNVKWEIDCDSKIMGAPNVVTDTKTQPYASSATGTPLSDYAIKSEPRTFVGEDGELYNVMIYQTIMSTQVEMIFRPDVVVETYKMPGGDIVLAYGTFGEIMGDFMDAQDPQQNYFGGRTIAGEVVFSVNVNTFEIAGLVEGEQTQFIKSAILALEITHFEDMHKQYTPYLNEEKIITGTGDWLFPTVITGFDTSYGGIEMYPTCEKALLGTGSIVHSDISTIDLDDVWDSSVYFSLPFELTFGANHVQAPIIPKIPYDTFVYQSEYKVLYDITFRVVSVWSEPIDAGLLPKTLFWEEWDKDTPFNFWAWIVHFFTNLWYSTIGKILVVGGLGGLLLIGLTFTKRGGKAMDKLTGRGGAVTQVTNVVIGQGNKLPDTVKKITGRAGRETKGLFNKLKRKLKFWK